jgi:hypothetical protein
VKSTSSSDPHILLYNVTLFRLKGLTVDGEDVSPVIHLRLAQPLQDREEEQRILQQIVDMVRIIYYSTVSHIFLVL